MVNTGRYDDYEDDMDRPRGLGAPAAPVQVDVSMTGDEAYQRRLAMSQGSKPATLSASSEIPSGPDMSFQPSSSSSSAIPIPSSLHTDASDTSRGDMSSDASRATLAQSGEEAYLRRLAMSQTRGAAATAAPPPIPPPVVSPPLIVAAEPSGLAYNPFAPPSAVPPPPSAIPPSLSDEKVRSSREAAAAIAAKLRALAPPPGSADASGAASSDANPQSSQDAPASVKKCVLSITFACTFLTPAGFIGLILTVSLQD